MKTTTKKSSSTAVKILPAKKGKWEIHKGAKTFWTRLVSRNGRVICSNTGFNTHKAAEKNINAIKASA